MKYSRFLSFIQKVCTFLLRHKLLTGALIIVLFIAGSFIFRNSGKNNGYVLDKAKLAELTEIVSESGSISSDGNIPVYSPANGMVSEMLVENETPVKADQKLFTVKSSATETEKQTALANYLSAKATLDADNAGLYSLQSAMYSAWKTYKDLATNSTFENADGSPKTGNRVLTEFTTVQDDWLAAEAGYKNQQGVIAKDQAALASAYAAYLATQTTTVKSPADGIISNISVSVGKTVGAQSVLNPSPNPVLVIKNSEILEAVIPVGQTNIAKVAIGQPVTVKPDAYKDKTYSGSVIRIDSIGKNVQGVVTYNVYANVSGDTYLKPGMTIDCDIITKKLENVVTVPNTAVVTEKGITSVRVLKGNAVQNLPVTTGIKGETQTQIVTGINPGQEVIVALTNEKAKKPSLLGL